MFKHFKTSGLRTGDEFRKAYWWIAVAVIGLLTSVVDSAAQNHATAGSAVSLANANSQPLQIPQCRVKLVHELSLACERSGVIDFIVSEGDSVKRGDVIARLRDSLAQASYRITEHESANDIEVRFARKAGELAQLKYERAQQAEQAVPGTVTDFELRELRLAAERSLLQLQQAEHQFAISQLKRLEQLEVLKSYQIIAPYDAYVRMASRRTGEYVQEGEVVVEVSNNDQVRIEGHVDVADLSRIAIGDAVAVQVTQTDGNIEVLRGTLSFVDSKIEPVSMKARVFAQVTNHRELLKDGLLVTMAVLPAQAH